MRIRDEIFLSWTWRTAIYEKDYRELERFKEFLDLSKELRESIQQMKRYYRFDVG